MQEILQPFRHMPTPKPMDLLKIVHTLTKSTILTEIPQNMMGKLSIKTLKEEDKES